MEEAGLLNKNIFDSIGMGAFAVSESATAVRLDVGAYGVRS